MLLTSTVASDLTPIRAEFPILEPLELLVILKLPDTESELYQPPLFVSTSNPVRVLPFAETLPTL